MPQTIINGFQHEQPDYWLTFGNPWEIERLIVQYPIKFYGHVSVIQEDGKQMFRWNAGETVRSVRRPGPAAAYMHSHTAAYTHGSIHAQPHAGTWARKCV